MVAMGCGEETGGGWPGGRGRGWPALEEAHTQRKRSSASPLRDGRRRSPAGGTAGAACTQLTRLEQTVCSPTLPHRLAQGSHDRQRAGCIARRPARARWRAIPAALAQGRDNPHPRRLPASYVRNLPRPTRTLPSHVNAKQRLSDRVVHVPQTPRALPPGGAAVNTRRQPGRRSARAPPNPPPPPSGRRGCTRQHRVTPSGSERPPPASGPHPPRHHPPAVASVIIVNGINGTGAAAARRDAHSPGRQDDKTGDPVSQSGGGARA